MNKYTEIIEKYLRGELSAEENIAFQKQLEINATLKTELDLQKQILKGIERSALKAQVKKGFKKGSFKSKSGKWFIGIVVAALAVSTVFVVKNKNISSHSEAIKYELNEENKKQWSEADKQLPSEFFTINGANDTVIETKGGIILSIPAHAFLNNTGDDVSENYDLEIKEAFNAFDIMKAGLSTTSNGRLLETGGMFYINARKDQENLTLAQNKGVYASIPDKNPGKNMMLFNGKRMPDGQINWVDPKPFENKLHAVDILNLNFYPPHFLDTLKSLGFDIKNKKLTDSIYYSFVCGGQKPAEASETEFDKDSTKTVVAASDSLKQAAPVKSGEKLFKQNCYVCHSTGSQKITGPGLAGMMSRVPSREWLISYILNNEKMIKSGDAYANKIYRENGKAAMTVFEYLSTSDVSAIINYINNVNATTIANSGSSPCEIEPSRIHAIWDKKFNNTLLATKEFEERLQAIFKTCNHNILDLYVQNLDKKMYQVDSLAMLMTEGSIVFREFYERKNGGISISENHLKKLQAYMQEKQTIYNEAALTTMRALYEKEKVQDQKAWQFQLAYNEKEGKRLNTIFKEELQTNMKEAYRQLGKEYKVVNPPAANYLDITLVSTGWKNVDAYVLESTVNRTTLDYTDKETGKKAIIKYEPFTLTVTDKAQYERVVVYLIPDKSSSFQRMPGNGNVFKENLNELFKYSAVVFGFKGNDTYCGRIQEATHGEKTITLTKMSWQELEQFRNANAGAAVDLVSELDHELFETKETLRKNAIAKREEIRARLWPVVFPCSSPQQHTDRTEPK